MTIWLETLAVLLRRFGDALYDAAHRAVQWLADWIINFFNVLKAFGDVIMSWIIGMMQSTMPAPAYASFTSRLEEINYFFPLSEAIAFGVMLAGFWLAVLLYRLVKSWIPTVSS